ncbi:MAG: LuxR C-terminal-related transcriptional regulator [Actinomycetia bacterium]|nr:LuxR C-terminal-related transcriptional regulator [Actinomycetes bacterium]
MHEQESRRHRCPTPGRRSRSGPRELEELRLVARGLSNAKIADRLYVTRRTVATHMEHILAKSGASSRVAVTTRAAQLGLVRI